MDELWGEAELSGKPHLNVFRYILVSTWRQRLKVYSLIIDYFSNDLFEMLIYAGGEIVELQQMSGKTFILR